MENDWQRRGRSGSRASSTSSSLEVRCACQYFRSDSLLPERSARAAVCRARQQHPRRSMVQTPPAGRRPPVRCGDHEYEPIGAPVMRLSISEQQAAEGPRLVAPVVKITDTDVIPVADSDDSIDDRYRFRQRVLILEGDVILPLDGRIEDNAMDGRNLGDQTIDTSGDELESPQQLQDRIEERFFNAATPGAESRTDAEISTSQVDSSMVEELPLRRGARGFQDKLKCQAGKLRSRLRGIQKPTFSMPRGRAKPAEKTGTATAVTVTVTDKPPASPRVEQKASRMERFRMALPERPRFSLPDKSKFHLPDTSKFHLPERPKFNLPDRSKFHIKKPNIQLPKSFSRPKRTASLRSQSREQSQAPSNAESTGSSTRRNIFDFSTYPRPKLFERRSKAKEAEYVTSSPKESRAQSTESSTFPRAKKSSLSLSQRWAQRFGETKVYPQDDEAASAAESARPWRHPSLEEPRLSLKPQTSEEEEVEEKLPWENTERRTYDAEDEAAPDDEEDREISYPDAPHLKEPELLTYEKEPVRDPRLYDERLIERIASEEPKKRVRLVEEEDEGSVIDPEAEDDTTYHPKGLYDGSFPPVDPRDFPVRGHSVEMSDEEGSSMRSDREVHQSSGSSYERRRQGVIEEIDSDEFFLREKGISQENMRFHLISEIRDALRTRTDETPPQRPKRTRSIRKRQEASVESFEAPPPERPLRERIPLERANSLSSHRVVYQMETPATRPRDEPASEPLDDIVVVKPARRKSRSSLRSQSQSALPGDEQNIVLAPMDDAPVRAPAPPVPCRRKRLRRDQSSSLSIRTTDSAMCNGFGDTGSMGRSHERIPPTPPPTPPLPGDELDYIVPEARAPPVPPKRTRSRTASLAPEDDRTSHGADSLPDFAYVDEEPPPLPRDSSSREPSLPGYAVIEKREKPPRPPPPRRKKQDKFATAPRPAKSGGPKRPLRNYSTLRPAKSDTIRKSVESITYIDSEYPVDEEFHRDLRSGEILSKIQGRPLPAPPRPPRHRHVRQRTPGRELVREITPDFSETFASTQTDPLPDDLVIEEEITTAKLVVAPSRSGSTQVLISTERVPSPSGGSVKSATSAGTPPIPPLPAGVQSRDPDRTRDADTEKSDRKAPPSDESRSITLAQLDALRSAIFSSDEPLRIPSLEVGDLKVDRLTVSQLEAYKVAASEIDAIVVSATEMSNKGETEGGIHPSLLQELIAIRNQLDAVMATQPISRPQSRMEDACTATSNERVDITPESERRPVERRSSFTRESSPLLVVQTPASDQESIANMGRTVLPLSGSTTDLTSASDSVTTTTEVTTTVLTVETPKEQSPVVSEPATTDKPEAPAALTSTTTTSSTTDSTTEIPVPQSPTPVTTTTTTTIDSTTEIPVPQLPTLVTTTTTTTTTTETATSELPVVQSTPRSRSTSPSRGLPGAVRQTASPVKSLPPVISVTPDGISTPASSTATADSSGSMPRRHVTSHGAQPQRAVISYSEDSAPPSSSPPSASRETSHSPPPPQAPQSRESSRSPPPPPPPSHQASPPPPGQTRFVAFPTSQIPPEFFALASPEQRARRRRASPEEPDEEPGVAQMAGQLARALHQAGTRSLRHFVDSVVSRFDTGREEPGEQSHLLDGEKLRRVELAMCALLLLVAALIVVCICTPKTITHHHHWDYFNPPQ